MEIRFPTATTYWIALSGDSRLAGETRPTQMTTFGQDWEILLQTTDEAEWRAAVALLPPDPLDG